MNNGLTNQELGKLSGSFAVADRVRCNGFAGPIRILSAAQCALILKYLRHDLKTPEEWMGSKGLAVADLFIYSLALHSGILGIVKELLGPDVVLWGASQIRRRPGEVHHWHSDIESSSPEGGFVSVWIGIENTRKETGLKFVQGSHLFGRTIQEDNFRNARQRHDTSDDIVLEMARAHRSQSMIFQPDVSDGDALFFDGRIWHGSHNVTANEPRMALLFQYAASNKRVYAIDQTKLEWPFQFSKKRPPCIVASGRSGRSVNLLVPSPSVPNGPIKPLTSMIYQFDFSPVIDSHDPWKMLHGMRGATSIHRCIACHASMLAPGHSPHPVHAHFEEELLIVLSGSVDLIIPDAEHELEPRHERLQTGGFVYYPAYQPHTIRNVGKGPASYVMLKWGGELSDADPRPVAVVTAIPKRPPRCAFDTEVLLQGPTNFLDRLKVHLTTLPPGGGYEPHSDDYDVAIIVLEGQVALFGGKLMKGGVAYCVAGRAHGMRNVGEDVARYLVLEFHRSVPVHGVSKQGLLRLEMQTRKFLRSLRQRLVLSVNRTLVV